MADDILSRQKAQLEAMREQLTHILENYQQNPSLLAEALAFKDKFHAYSMNNAALIQKQNPYATYVAGFNKWKELGYSVKKGQHGIKVLVPQRIKLFPVVDRDGRQKYKLVSQATDDEAKAIALGEIRVMERTAFGVGIVFDISQTDCPVQDYPKLYNMGYASATHADLYAAIKAYVEQTGGTLGEADLSSISLRGTYDRVSDTITLSDKLNDTQKLDTITHELGHSVMCKEEKQLKQEVPRAIAELEADAVSIMLQTYVGLELTDARKSHFVQHYKAAEALDGFRLQDVLKRVNAAYYKLRQGLDPYLDKALEHSAQNTKETQKAEQETRPAYRYEIYQETTGVLSLAVLQEQEGCIYYRAGYENNPEELRQAIEELKQGANPHSWADNSGNPGDAYSDLLDFSTGLTLVADQDGIYQKNIGSQKAEDVTHASGKKAGELRHANYELLNELAPQVVAGRRDFVRLSMDPASPQFVLISIGEGRYQFYQEVPDHGEIIVDPHITLELDRQNQSVACLEVDDVNAELERSALNALGEADYEVAAELDPYLSDLLADMKEAGYHKAMELPKKVESSVRVTEYLTKMQGIDPMIVEGAIRDGTLYEDTRHNAVFVGRDDLSNQVVAYKHTTIPSSGYKQQVENSEPDYGVTFGSLSGERLYVTQEPIDSLKRMTKGKVQGDYYDSHTYLATCDNAPDAVVLRYLENHPEVKEVVLDHPSATLNEQLKAQIQANKPALEVLDALRDTGQGLSPSQTLFVKGSKQPGVEKQQNRRQDRDFEMEL